DPARRVLDAVLTARPRNLDEWGLACADHLHAIRTRPAQDVQHDILLDLLSIRHQLQSPGDEDATELHRILATLSTLHANVLHAKLGPRRRRRRAGGGRGAGASPGFLRGGLPVRGQRPIARGAVHDGKGGVDQGARKAGAVLDALLASTAAR
ncbi:hypothetical protein ACFQ07_30980, partial [Actinomadura adrarensis]